MNSKYEAAATLAASAGIAHHILQISGTIQVAEDDIMARAKQGRSELVEQEEAECQWSVDD
jgi:hypothetical protein